MDQETREMFEKIVGLIGEVNTKVEKLENIESDVATLKSDVGTLKSDVGTLKSDVGTLKSDVGTLKSDVSTLKSDVGTLKSDVATLKSDVATLKSDGTTLKSDMVAMKARQDEMYLILRGWEENRNIVKALEEKSLVATSEIDKLKIQTSKVIGAVRRSSQEAIDGLADEVS